MIVHNKNGKKIVKSYVLKQLDEDGKLIDLDNDVSLKCSSFFEFGKDFRSSFDTEEEALEMLRHYPYDISDVVVQVVYDLRNNQYW